MFLKSSNRLDKTTRDYIENHLTLEDKVKELKNNYDFSNLLVAIKELNKTHSTHLSLKEMEEIARRISNKYLNFNSFKSCLDEIPSNSIEYLFKELCRPCNGSKRKNISFASKFIVMFSKYLKCSAHDNYSKFDDKLSNDLFGYLKQYSVSGNYSKNTFDKYYNGHNENVNTLWDFYKNYCFYIGELIKVARKVEGYHITREEADHIIWF